VPFNGSPERAVRSPLPLHGTAVPLSGSAVRLNGSPERAIHFPEPFNGSAERTARSPVPSNGSPVPAIRSAEPINFPGERTVGTGDPFNGSVVVPPHQPSGSKPPPDSGGSHPRQHCMPYRRRASERARCVEEGGREPQDRCPPLPQAPPRAAGSSRNTLKFRHAHRADGLHQLQPQG
jgi:hypothetical protein